MKLAVVFAIVAFSTLYCEARPPKCKGNMDVKAILESNCQCRDRSFCRSKRKHNKCETDERVRRACPCTCALSPVAKGANADRMNANDCFNTLYKKCDANGPIGMAANSKCPLICSNPEKRFRTCCNAMGIDSKCRVFCTYRIASRLAKLELRKGGCMHILSKWSHCAAQGHDHSQCCRREGLDEKAPCFPVCNKGQLPQSCSAGSKKALEDCSLDNSNVIIRCFEENQPAISSWNPNVELKDLDDGCEATDQDGFDFVNGGK